MENGQETAIQKPDAKGRVSEVQHGSCSSMDDHPDSVNYSTILEPVVLFYISLTLVEAAPHRLETTLMHGRIYVA
jgi:hypothetical protein